MDYTITCIILTFLNVIACWLIYFYVKALNERIDILERSMAYGFSSDDSYTPIAYVDIIGDHGNLTKNDYKTWENMYGEIANLPTKDPDKDN